MIGRVADWMKHKWNRQVDSDQTTLLESYYITFSTFHGQQVLNHLMDSVYCTTYEGRDPIEAALHNGRRSVVQEILENVDLVEHKDKRNIKVEEE